MAVNMLWCIVQHLLISCHMVFNLPQNYLHKDIFISHTVYLHSHNPELNIYAISIFALHNSVFVFCWFAYPEHRAEHYKYSIVSCCCLPVMFPRMAWSVWYIVSVFWCPLFWMWKVWNIFANNFLVLRIKRIFPRTFISHIKLQRSVKWLFERPFGKAFLSLILTFILFKVIDNMLHTIWP